MKLLRVQVPDFRVLNNVDISFEKDFVPSIFPLGSQNGGGKSTLLQLIFVLLHCSGDRNKHEFIKNMLYGFKIDDDSQKRVLASFDIWDGEKTVNLEFIAYKDSYAGELLTSTDENIANDKDEKFKFSSIIHSNILKKEIERNDTIITSLEDAINQLETTKKIKNALQRNLKFREIELNVKSLDSSKILKSRLPSKLKTIEDYQDEIEGRLEIYKNNFINLYIEYDQMEDTSKKILNVLRSKQMICICSYFTYEDEVEDEVLLCHINNIDITKTESFLNQLSENIFLAAPATQVFLFLDKNSKNLLFKHQDNSNANNYSSKLKLSQSKLSKFFTYDFLAVDLFVDIFKSARDKDFAQAVETGKYGNNYQQLVHDLNLILLNKKININTDLSGFTFKSDNSGQDIELFPEDLSHGELKRLSIYAWIKYNIIEDSIVLIDEIENGLHPDWQYQIIKDIAEWAPKNQYIIATHSYELCQAVTPAHVKELEPRLIKQESES